MGLDSYLLKKTYVKNWDHYRPQEVNHITIKKGDVDHPTIKIKRISFVIEEVGYWRKFNALHNWFVKNVQNGVDECQESHVPKHKLEELLDLLKKVKEEHTKGPDLLPTAGGFFFGSTDYDDWYFDDVDRTVTLLEDLLKEPEDDCSDYYYQSSW